MRYFAIILLKYDKTEILESFGLSPDKKTVLFFGGGEFGLGKAQTFKIFKSLINITFIKYTLLITIIL